MFKTKPIILQFLLLPVLAILAWSGQIHDAVEKGNVGEVKALVAKDPGLVNALDDFRNTPLHIAALVGNRDIAEFLIGKGADLNSGAMYGMTPLHMAAGSGKSSIIELLLIKGAAIDGKDIYDKTPLYWAAANDQANALDFLLSKGADKEAKDIFGRTPLDASAWGGALKATELLIRQGARVNATDQGGDTPLHGAVYEGHKQVVELLVSKGADVNAKNNKGRTPSDNALRRGHKDVLDLLAAKGGKCAVAWQEEPVSIPRFSRNPAGEKAPLKFTVLSDNYVFSNGTKSEWGFCCLIEGMEKTILFDAGTSPEVLLHNINALKVDVGRVEQIVISHDHEDHTGGLPAILSKNHALAVYLPYSSSYGLLREAENSGAQVFAPRSAREICRNVFLEEEMATGQWAKEQALILNTAKGLVIVTGCAHQGIINVLKKAKDMFDRDIYLVFGGFHLLDKSEDQVKEIIAQFKELGVQNCGATHCTGPKAIAMFKEAYGDHYFVMGTGRVLTISDQP